ncbi:Putative SOS response-associated peptidase YedK [Rubripirellula lacrimiformis]|uniref:Abasic site processing protein n=1 Tax=Rubripirellula lacrimiformis TaxID=1930273 RepID=A0A517N5C7_9BACT|nr:SOS response-associated peptidase [Rubripirellula lacrimiformis]QDT02347.1 Putative SOS response-associated peptidase YedK [Rubripirellula lacrimiformis]
MLDSEFVCGRLTLRSPPTQWCQQFLPHVDPDGLDWGDAARFNIAPTQPVLCVLQPGPAETATTAMIRWGLVPAWSDDPGVGSRMINARSETVDTKPSFRSAFARQRCLVLADGYYEWKTVGKTKQPYLIQPPELDGTQSPGSGTPGSETRGSETPGSGTVLVMAGLWDTHPTIVVDGQPLRTCTILTTAANPITRPIHDRMPVLLDVDRGRHWINPEFDDRAALKSWCLSPSEIELAVRPVQRYVNNARHEGPRCIDPPQDERLLF